MRDNHKAPIGLVMKPLKYVSNLDKMCYCNNYFLQ